MNPYEFVIVSYLLIGESKAIEWPPVVLLIISFSFSHFNTRQKFQKLWCHWGKIYGVVGFCPRAFFPGGAERWWLRQNCNTFRANMLQSPGLYTIIGQLPFLRINHSDKKWDFEQIFVNYLNSYFRLHVCLSFCPLFSWSHFMILSRITKSQ